MTARLARDFDPKLTGASRSALLELARALKHYSEGLILVGGWVPCLLIRGHLRPGDPFTHVGSIDIDLVVDPNKIGEDEYRTIVEMIQDIGWRSVEGKRFSFARGVPCPDGQIRDIQVDLLTPAPKISGRGTGTVPSRPTSRLERCVAPSWP